MQERKSQAERRAQTQRALINAARQLFAQKGYAETGTPEIVALARLTRGALYHHFADKLALFEAVVGQELLLVAMETNASVAGHAEPGPVKALLASGDAMVSALQAPGRRQILLIDAPAVLGRSRLAALQEERGAGALQRLIEAAMAAKAVRTLPAQPLAKLLGALFEQAAQADPQEQADYRKTIKALIRGLRL